MSLALGQLLPFARAYLEHAGLELPESGLREELERRLKLLPAWGRAAAGLGALYARRAGPALALRTLRPFERLDPEQREAVLARLQRSRAVAARALFFAAKSVVLGAAYGRPGVWEKKGYRMGEP